MTITIDGTACSCEPGEFLLEIAGRNGIKIPILCHHEGLPGQGCCRVCIVEVEVKGWRRVVTACVFPVEKECAVYTNSDNIIRQRGMMLSLLRSLAPESDEVARLCVKHDAPEYERFVKRSGEKCILCGLCARACGSLGTGAISTVSRGVEKKVTTPYDEASIACVGCASCAEICPTGSIALTEIGDKRTIWNKTFPIKACKNCDKAIGTFMELSRSAEKAGTERPELCNACRKKSVADAMAATYGR